MAERGVSLDEDLENLGGLNATIGKALIRNTYIRYMPFLSTLPFLRAQWMTLKSRRSIPCTKTRRPRRIRRAAAQMRRRPRLVPVGWLWIRTTANPK